MKINTELKSYQKNHFYQKKFSDFEKVYSETMKKNPKVKALYQDLKSFMPLEKQEKFTYDQFKMGIVYNNADDLWNNIFGGVKKVSYEYNNIDRENSDLILEKGTKLNYKGIAEFTVQNDYVDVKPLTNLSDDQLAELNHLAFGLDRFIRYANDQIGRVETIHELEDDLIELLNMKDGDVINGVQFTKEPYLKKVGIDSRFNLFNINQTIQQMKSFGIDYEWY